MRRFSAAAPSSARRAKLAALGALLLGLAALAARAPAEENRRDDVDSTADSGVLVPQARRPILDVISLAISAGKDININEDLARLLGLRVDDRARVLRVPAYRAPDHLDHAFEVVYRKARGDAIRPVAVLLDVAQTQLWNGSKHVERRTMLVSLDGALEKAARESGGFQSVERSSVTVSSVQGLYERELNFFRDASTKLSSSLPLD